MSSQSPYKDFASFPSGTNYDDYLNWCLGAMFREEATTAVCSSNRKNNEIEIRESTSTCTDSAILQGADESDGTAPFPLNYFFKGFLAWALWGHLPIQAGAMMKSSLFTEAKTDTAFGRNITSRRAIASGGMKKPGEVLESSVSRSRSGRKRQVSESSGLASSGLASPTPTEDTDDKSYLFMTQTTMELFQHEFLERELQKQRSIEIRMVRDEIASLTRKSDRLHSDYCRLKEGRAANEAKEIMDEHEQRISLLETKLKKIQEEEIERRNAMLRQHQRKLDNKNNTERHNKRVKVDDKRPNIEEENDFSTEPPMSVVVAFQPPTGVAQSLTMETPPRTQRLALVCIECSVNTTHKCHRCKRYVCTICCSEKRNLEMSWWCQECFDAESVDKQQKIRAG